MAVLLHREMTIQMSEYSELADPTIQLSYVLDLFFLFGVILLLYHSGLLFACEAVATLWKQG